MPRCRKKLHISLYARLGNIWSIEAPSLIASRSAWTFGDGAVISVVLRCTQDYIVGCQSDWVRVEPCRGM